MKRVWRGLPFVVAAGGLMCGTPRPAELAAPQGTVVAPGPSAAAVVTASASAAVAALPAPPPRLPIRSATPGKVQCETVDCDVATEVCCVTPGLDRRPVGRCVARSGAPAGGLDVCCPGGDAYCGNNGVTVHRGCDEAADCAAGQRCCAWGSGEGDLERDTCEAECFSERCLPGSTCPNGNRCSAEDGAAAGTCPLQIKPPRCGGATCKTGELCCWEEGRARCAGSCAEDAGAVLACTAPDQCAPYACHTYAGMSPPRYTCGGEGFYSGVLCQSQKDCPGHLSALGTGPEAPKLRGCGPSRELPPGVKECQYR